MVLTKKGILVSSSHNIQFLRLRVVTQPTPTATLNRCNLSVKLLLQTIQSTKVPIDCILQHTTAELSTTLLLRSEVLPEQSVVDVTTTVKVDGLLKSNGGFDIFLVKSFRELFFGGVETVEVSLMVFGMVEFHDLTGDGGFESSVIVGKIGEGVLAADRGSGEGARAGLEGGEGGGSGAVKSGTQHFG